MDTRQTVPPALDSFIVQMPKIELHLHLEGTIRPTTLLEIARRNHVEIPARDVTDLMRLFHYSSFHQFLSVFMQLVHALRRGEDFAQIAYELGHHLANQHVLYAEVMISPSQYYNRGLDLSEVLEGVAAGFAQARRERGIQLYLACDYGRQFGVEAAWRVLEIAAPHAPDPLVAWSIGGDELCYPPEPYAEVFAAARQAGMHTMAHAGEVVGPASVWGAVDTLGVERLGHGIRSISDPVLLEHLRNRGVTLDICPMSNLCTGASPSLQDHPLRRLFDAGVALTINTDDPVFFNTTLTDEYRLAASAFGFGADQLAAVVCNAARAVFQPAPTRAALLAQVQAEIAALRAELGV